MTCRCLLLLALVLPGVAAAGEWRYGFAPGKTYRYAFSSSSKQSMQMPMMGAIDSQMKVNTEYGLRVLKKLPDGRSDVAIDVEKLVIKDSLSGKEITLQDLPASFRTFRAYVTPRGRFQFYEKVVVQIEEGGTYSLGVVKSSPAGASSQVTVSDGQEEVSLTASIDAKTGKVSASVTKKAAKKKTREVEEERPVQHVDVLPVDILALMELPEGPVKPGMSFSMKAPGFDVKTTAEPPTGCGKASCGLLRIQTGMDSKAATAAPIAAGMAEQGEMDTEESSMGGMPSGMGMPGMPGGMDMGSAMGMGAAASTGMEMKLDARMRFDEAAANLYDVQGTMSQRTSSMGMKITDDTEFKLEARGIK